MVLGRSRRLIRLVSFGQPSILHLKFGAPIGSRQVPTRRADRFETGSLHPQLSDAPRLGCLELVSVKLLALKAEPQCELQPRRINTIRQEDVGLQPYPPQAA